MSIEVDYLRRALGSPALAAAALALDLNRGDEEALKAGYSVENAVLAAQEIFPKVTERAIRELNGWVGD